MAAFGADDAPTNAKNNTIVMGYTESRPYAYTENGAPSGLSIAIARALAKKTGHAIEFVPIINPAKAFEDMASGKIHMSSLLGVSNARTQYGTFGKSSGYLSISVFVRAGESVLWNSATLQGANVGVVNGSIGQDMAGRFPKAKFHVYDDNRGLLMALLSGEIDAVIEPEEQFNRLTQYLGYEHQTERLDAPLVYLSLSYLFAPDATQLRMEMDNALIQLSADGTIEEIEHQWLSPPHSLWENIWVLWALICVLSILLATSLAIFHTSRQKGLSEVAMLQTRLRQDLQNFIDGLDIAIIIFGPDQRILMWNKKMSIWYPKITDYMEKQPTYAELIEYIYFSGQMEYPGKEKPSERDIKKLSADIAQAAWNGETNRRLVFMQDGRILQCQDYLMNPQSLVLMRSDITQSYQNKIHLGEVHKHLLQADKAQATFAMAVASHVNAFKTAYTQTREKLQDLHLVSKNQENADLDALFSAYDRQIAALDHLECDLQTYAQSRAKNTPTAAYDPASHLDALARQAGVPSSFAIEVCSELPCVTVNRREFDMVVRNLLASAIRNHDRSQGRISVRGWRDGDHVFYEIRDDGPGIPDDFKNLCASPEQKDNDQNIALGTIMFKHSVEKWNGTISVETGENGRGCIVRFSIRQNAVDLQLSAKTPDDAHPSERIDPRQHRIPGEQNGSMPVFKVPGRS